MQMSSAGINPEENKDCKSAKVQRSKQGFLDLETSPPPCLGFVVPQFVPRVLSFR